MVENDMLPAVVKWLRAKGCEILTEIQLGCYCDVVGVEFFPRTGRAIPQIKTSHAVELKLTDHARAFEQAKCYAYHGGYVWIAMPDDTVSRMRPETIRRLFRHEIGLLSVDVQNDAVVVILNSEHHGPMRRDAYKKRWAYLKRKKRDVAKRARLVRNGTYSKPGWRDWIYKEEESNAKHKTT